MSAVPNASRDTFGVPVDSRRRSGTQVAMHVGFLAIAMRLRDAGNVRLADDVERFAARLLLTSPAHSVDDERTGPRPAHRGRLEEFNR